MVPSDLSAGGDSGEGEVMKYQCIGGNWGSSIFWRRPIALEQRWLKVSCRWSWAPEGSGLLKVRFFPIDDFLPLMFSIGRIASLGVGFHMLSFDDYLEVMTSEVAGLGVYDLICVFYKLICIVQFVFALLDMVWKDYWWERIGLTILSPNIRVLQTPPRVRYVWLKGAVWGREVMNLVGPLFKECVTERQLTKTILGLLSMLVSIVHLWLKMCLFSVVINTVHHRTKHGPVQCVWLYYSSSVWRWDPLSFGLFDYVLSYSLLNVALLEYTFVLRKLVRNLSGRCVPRKADLVVERLPKLHWQGLAPVFRHFNLRPRYRLCIDWCE